MKIHWMPAHTGIKLNEVVDRAAKESIQVGRDAHRKIPNSDFKDQWKLSMKKEFHDWCLQSGQQKGKEYFKDYYKESASPWFHKFKFRRRAIVSINRMRSGHTSVLASLKKINIVKDDLCECGEERETLNHIFWQCKKFQQQRDEFFKALIKEKLYPPYNIQSFLCNMNEHEITMIAKFINSIDKYI